jgi:hypothetical protein
MNIVRVGIDIAKHKFQRGFQSASGAQQVVGLCSASAAGDFDSVGGMR